MNKLTRNLLVESDDPQALEIAANAVIDESIPTGQIRRAGQLHAVIAQDQLVVLDRKLRRELERFSETAKRTGLTPEQAAAAACAVLGVDPEALTP